MDFQGRMAMFSIVWLILSSSFKEVMSDRGGKGKGRDRGGEK